MYRSGIGYDLHPIAAGRPLVLGGVRIDAPFGLQGHSDADAVLHAICDALLGAAGQGDIGEHFPDTDPAYRDADSRVLLAEVVRRVRGAGFCVENCDCTILAERPKLGPRKQEIRASIADVLGILPADVNVKATTNEGLDAIGRGEAIACLATVMLRREVDP